MKPLWQLVKFRSFFRISDTTTASGFNQFDQIINESHDDIIIGYMLFQNDFSGCTIFVDEGMVFLLYHGELAEFEEYVIKHIGILLHNTFSDVRAVSCKPQQCQVLGFAPRLHADEILLIEVNSGNNVCTGSYINPDKQS